MAIKLYYNKNTYQLITIDDGGESIVVGDDGGKEFQFYFGTGTELSDYVNDVTIPVNFLGRAVIERPDGEVTNELYLTPQSGYFKLIITDWISQVEGNLEITTRLKVSDGDGGYVVYPFTVATIPVEAGVAPGDDTIEDAQYQALLDAVNAIPTGTTPFQQIILYNAAGNAIATYNGTNIIWAYRGINAEMFENLFVEVTANGNIANGDVVQYDSAIGASGKIRAKKAVASEINANPKLILGVATNAISNGQDGTVNWFGEINGINTTGYTAGQIVYYASESATPGQFTATKPTAPNVQIELGIVKVVHGTQGVIKIRPCFGMFLSELHDIHVNGHVFVGGETIMFNIATNRYEIYDLGGKVVEIEGRIGLVETGLGTAEGAIDAVELRLDTAEDDIDDLEEANMVKSIARTGTNLITLTFYDNTTSNILTLAELKSFIGEATQSLNGLMSITDKQRLDALHAMLGVTADADNVVNTINEIMEIFETYPEGANILEALNGKANKIDVYTKPETYTQQEINALFDNLSSVKGLKSTLLTPTELSNGDTISTNLLTNNGAYIVFTATDTSTEEIDSDTVPVSTIKNGKKFVFFDNQEIVFTIGSTTSTFETSENITLKINLLYLYNENVQAVDVEFDGSLTNYLLSQTNVQEAIEKIDEELNKTQTDLDNKVDKTSIIDNLTTNDATKPLSAKQGKALKDLVDTTVGNIDAILDSILGV